MGGRPKGLPKTGGRRPGSTNKKSISLQKMCEDKGINPFEKLLEYLEHPCEPALRLQAIKEACKYIYPQLRSIDVSVQGKVEHSHRLLQGAGAQELDEVILIEPTHDDS